MQEFGIRVFCENGHHERSFSTTLNGEFLNIYLHPCETCREWKDIEETDRLDRPQISAIHTGAR